MKRTRGLLRITAILMMVVYVQGLVLPGLVKAQEPECTYNREKPTLENARLLFKITDYRCAEQELQDLLKSDSLDLKTKADAHVLLAAVYYAQLHDQEEKESKVLAEFVAAFQAFREWRGELDIKSEDFEALMEEAKVQVDQQATEEAQTAAQDSVTTAQPPITDTWSATTAQEQKKPWYKKWWVIGLGVGVVAAGVAVAAGGGGGDDGGGDEQPAALSDFPSHP
jgi:hypothetical protein